MWWKHHKVFEIWASLRTPDGNSERWWQLQIFRRRINLPIRYGPDNHFWMKVERWLESHGFLDVSW